MISAETIREHMLPYERKAYFNSAGSSLMSRATLEAVMGHLVREASIGGYEAFNAAHPILSETHQLAAKLLGCNLNEVAITSSHASGWNEVVRSMQFAPGDRILIGRSEWGGNWAALNYIAKQVGAQVEVIPSNEYGEVCTEQLKSMIDERVKLISLTWLPANGGLINPAEQVGLIASQFRIPYVLDAAQALGQIPIDVKKIKCDALTAPGRKWLRGPRGTGLLFVKESFLAQLKPGILDTSSSNWNGSEFHVRADAKRFEASEASIAGRIGLHNAIGEVLTLGIENITKALGEKSHKLRNMLAHLPRVQLQDLGRKQSALVSFTINGMIATEARKKLLTLGIDVGGNGVSFTPLDMKARGLTEIMRASPHIYTTDEDIELLINGIRQITK